MSPNKASHIIYTSEKKPLKGIIQKDIRKKTGVDLTEKGDLV